MTHDIVRDYRKSMKIALFITFVFLIMEIAGETALAQLWVFIIAPIIGALIAAVVWKYLFEDSVPMV